MREPAPRGRGHSRQLDRAKIAAAALDLARASGLEPLSMRRIAAALDVDVATLYRHFRNKDDLLAEVAGAAAGAVELEVPSAGSWRERCLRVAEAIRRRLLEHPELALLGGPSPWLTPFNARATGALARALEGSGLEGAERFFAAQSLLHLVTAVANSESLTGAASTEDARRWVNGLAASLPEGLARDWRALARRDAGEIFDAYFSFAVGALLDGITGGAKGDT